MRTLSVDRRTKQVDRELLTWHLAFVPAAAVQVVAVWYSGGKGILMELSSLQAYIAGLCVLMLLATEVTGPTLPAAPRAVGVGDWVRGTYDLFRSATFRSLTPACAILLIAGSLMGGGELAALLARVDSVHPAVILLVLVVQVARVFSVWAVTVVLLGLVLVLVEAEVDLRFVGALTGYAYAPLPVAILLLLAYQYALFPEASATDRRVLLPAIITLRVVEVWAVFVIARGLYAERAGGRTFERSLILAAIPYSFVHAAKLGFSFVLG